MSLDKDNLFKDEAWNKARVVDGLDPRMFRLDACGALIMYERYGMVNPFGWEVDHVFPKALGGEDDLVNLRALHYENNRSKGDDYPSYIAAVKYDGKGNIKDMRSLTVNDKLRSQLQKLYKNA